MPPNSSLPICSLDAAQQFIQAEAALRLGLIQVLGGTTETDMNIYFLSAAVVCVLVGIVHSILGEILIFNNLRVGGIVPTEAAPPLLSRNVRIIWATWHLASIFGLLLAGILLAAAVGKITLDSIAIYAFLAAFVAGSALVFLATNGMHPGWIGLLSVAVLVYLGRVT